MNVALREQILEEIKENSVKVKVQTMSFLKMKIDFERGAKFIRFALFPIFDVNVVTYAQRTSCSKKIMSFEDFSFNFSPISRRLQTTYHTCIDVLAAVCETTSLATLSLYFPPQRIWQCEILNVSIIAGDIACSLFIASLLSHMALEAKLNSLDL